jgi:hypothetical protein
VNQQKSKTNAKKDRASTEIRKEGRRAAYPRNEAERQKKKDKRGQRYADATHSE